MSVLVGFWIQCDGLGKRSVSGNGRISIGLAGFSEPVSCPNDLLCSSCCFCFWFFTLFLMFDLKTINAFVLLNKSAFSIKFAFIL
jgi:hypothetical protein